MLLLKNSADLRCLVHRWKGERKTVGFVPTMGALHAGHVSLVEAGIRENPITVCSIFVNPRQFNDPKDFEKYPVTIEKDIQMLESSGCTAVFLPSVTELYRREEGLPLHYDLGYLEVTLEGSARPGHFQGVCMVVHRLLNIVDPDWLYLGQKDYQQCMVIKKLIELIDKPQIKLHICPTLREADGLAMSSRNMRLNESERKMAPAIYGSLQYIKKYLEKGDLVSLKSAAAAQLSAPGFKTDYLEIADASTLQIMNDWDGRQRLVALAAVFLNEIRLIDNLLLNE